MLIQFKITAHKHYVKPIIFNKTGTLICVDYSILTFFAITNLNVNLSTKLTVFVGNNGKFIWQ